MKIKWSNVGKCLTKHLAHRTYSNVLGIIGISSSIISSWMDYRYYGPIILNKNKLVNPTDFIYVV